MARRKNKKRIDPRYFLHETTHRDEIEEGKETLAQWEAVAISPEEVKKDEEGVYYIVDAQRAREASKRGATAVYPQPYGEHGAKPNEQLFLVYPGSMSHWISGPGGQAMGQQNPRISKVSQ